MRCYEPKVSPQHITGSRLQIGPGFRVRTSAQLHALSNALISEAAAVVLQTATVISMVISSYLVVSRYPNLSQQILGFDGTNLKTQVHRETTTNHLPGQSPIDAPINHASPELLLHQPVSIRR